MGAVGVMDHPLVTQETQDVLADALLGLPIFGDIGLIYQVNDFNWLWPVFEANLCGTNASVRALKHLAHRNHIKELTVTNGDVREACHYFADRYARDDAASYAHLTALAPPKADETDNVLLNPIHQGLQEPDGTKAQATALLFVVYRLRNNLFHGTKAQRGLEGQTANFRHANALLRAWITAGD